MSARRLLPALVTVTALAVAVTVVVVLLRGGPAGAPAAGGERSRGHATEALDVLAAWDQQRSLAWSKGDPAALSGLYTEGSGAGRRDAAMLGAYADRGLRVVGLRTQVLAVDVLAAEPRPEPTLLRLRVTDRIVGARAVARTASASAAGHPLPVDRPTTRVVVLRRADAASRTWRVATVTAQPRASPASSTAATSWSRKP